MKEILKVLGISYITEFASAICQDAGEKSIAGKIELAGKVAIFLPRYLYSFPSWICLTI